MGFLDKKNINVVHDDDLKSFLIRLGVYDDVISQKKKCKFTDEIITIDNLYCVFKLGGDIKFVCDSPDAVILFSEFLNNKK